MSKFKDKMSLTLQEASKEAWRLLDDFTSQPDMNLPLSIRKEFEEYMPKGTITVYRGMYWEKKWEKEIFKTLILPKTTIKNGLRVKYISKRTDSWTTDFNIAIKFADVENEDLSGDVGIVIKRIITAKDILIPLYNIPANIRKQNMYDFNQKEVILKPGSHDCTIATLFGEYW